MNLQDYQKYFVDFQHPSDIGHLLIAREIIKKIYPNSFDIELLNDCGKIRIIKNGEKKTYSLSKGKVIDEINTNITWLKIFMEKVQAKSYYKLYLKKAEEKKLICS